MRDSESRVSGKVSKESPPNSSQTEAQRTTDRRRQDSNEEVPTTGVREAEEEAELRRELAALRASELKVAEPLARLLSGYFSF